MIRPTVQAENYTLYRGDCLDVLPTLAAGSVDAVITDPPYGVGKLFANRRNGTKFTGGFHWDGSRPSSAVFDWISAQSAYVIWGGNYFADYLGVCAAPLMWHKCQDWNGAEFELAWTKNIKGNADTFWKSRVIAHSEMTKVHPTQKPVDLMKWCIKKATRPNAFILDPFMGSGTTGVACAKTGRKFIGIELDADYFDIAHARIANAFGDHMPTPKEKQSPQLSLLEAIAA